MSSRHNIEIAEDFLNRLGRKDFEGVGQLLAENAVIMLPFLPNSPVLEGRQAILEQFAASMGQTLENMKFTFDAWYPTTEDDVLVGEYHSKCDLKEFAGTYENTYITIARFDGDKIVSWKEYCNPSRLNFGTSSLNAD